MVSVKKRFIAGAVCPSCSAMDRIVMYREGESDFRECVECGFKDEMRFKTAVRELDTRVNQDEVKVAQETQVLQFPPIEK
ncbi:YheV family putative zinc ribbon protein [Simiduia curdlanivorans]|uniref:YheV family putative zinc ribbon protein n=1 Tax=Simiduia curdlanivorans TaxID=1492769 RepID=A0ABV8V1W0_9GAMM|nr:YheV family putative zinc ribbon protein [Simiduia curdlanivorans]MDN3638022.1 YheV family putative zinc ribbon protein [Simiduia curdlanivorans]